MAPVIGFTYVAHVVQEQYALLQRFAELD